jgi:hypothetical protein
MDHLNTCCPTIFKAMHGILFQLNDHNKQFVTRIEKLNPQKSNSNFTDVFICRYIRKNPLVHFFSYNLAFFVNLETSSNYTACRLMIVCFIPQFSKSCFLLWDVFRQTSVEKELILCIDFFYRFLSFSFSLRSVSRQFMQVECFNCYLPWLQCFLDCYTLFLFHFPIYSLNLGFNILDIDLTLTWLWRYDV